jgi:hypothetical protein
VLYTHMELVCVTLSVCARDTIFAQVCVLYTHMELVCVCVTLRVCARDPIFIQ